MTPRLTHLTWCVRRGKLSGGAIRKLRCKFSPNPGRFSLNTQLWSGLRLAACWRRRQNKQLCWVGGKELCMPNEAIMSVQIELCSSRSGVFVCGTRWKENGEGEKTLKISSSFVKSECERRGRERATERSVSELGRWGWGEREWEEIRGRRIREELKAGEWKVRHNYMLAAKPRRF